jgi:hypothetical protein
VYVFDYGAEFKPVTDGQQPPVVTISRGRSRVTTLVEPRLVEPYFVTLSVRSAQCLYLWRCQSHWAGLDYYYDHVRSAQCGWLWRCGYRLQTFYVQYLRDHRGTPN